MDEGDWTRELVRMNAAYAGDSLLVYLYFPKRGAKPYPAVVYFPGSSAIRDHAPQNLQVRAIDFIVKSGRAVLYPVYKGTYQRSDSLNTDVQDTSNFYRDHVVMWAKDLRRGVDYLETRPEVATGHLAYYGLSWGGAIGGLMPAVEPRIRVSALYVAGLDFERARPEVEPINFIPRIRIAVRTTLGGRIPSERDARPHPARDAAAPRGDAGRGSEGRPGGPLKREPRVAPGLRRQEPFGCGLPGGLAL